MRFRYFGIIGCRLGLAGVFLWASGPKILDPPGFALNIENYQILPDVLVNLWALLLPWMELSASIGLLAGTLGEAFQAPRLRNASSGLARGASLVCGLLLLVFIVAIASAVLRDLSIDCGCFGTQGGRRVGLAALLKDFGFLALAVGAFFPLASPSSS